MRAGSVNAFQTKSRGASNVREMTNSPSGAFDPALTALFVDTFFSFDERDEKTR
jgi:hypothetical protein